MSSWRQQIDASLLSEPGQSFGKGAGRFQRGMAQLGDHGASEPLEAYPGGRYAQFIRGLMYLPAQQVVGDQQAPDFLSHHSSGRLLRKTLSLACMLCLISRKPSSISQRSR